MKLPATALPRALLWLIGVITLGATLAALLTSGHFQVQSDLLALLPEPQRDPVKTAAMQRIASLGERRVAIFITAPNRETRNQAAQAAAASLKQDDAFDEVVSHADDWLDAEQRQTLADLNFRYRFQLLAPDDRAALQALAGGDKTASQGFMQRAQARLYGLGTGDSGRFVDDPFGLASAYRNALTSSPALPGIRIAPDGQLFAEAEDGTQYAAVFAQTRVDPFTISAQAAQSAGLQAALQAARQSVPSADQSNLQILTSGVLQHAAAATRTAQTEISLIGGGSLLGILLLMLWAFASLRPYFLSLLAIAGGCLLAVVVTASLFGGVHMLTLVFGASLVGVAIDYCFHFFAQRWHTPQPGAALARIFPAISLGLATSVLAYGGMAIAPFPALRQMAVFAAFGLIGAWLSVVLLLPLLAGSAPRRQAALNAARLWLGKGPTSWIPLHTSTSIASLAGLFVLVAGLAAAWLAPDDDIRLLYTPAPELLHDEQAISKLLGTQTAGRAIAINGDSAQAVLQAEAALVNALTRPAPPIAEVSAITATYSPLAQQRRDYALLADTLYKTGGPVEQLLAGVGFSAQAIQTQRKAFQQAKDRTLEFDQWRTSPAGEALGPLWLGQTSEGFASVILVHGINDAKAFSRFIADNEQVTNIDRVADISALLGRYRGLATWLLAGAYGLAGIILCLAFGLKGALTVLLAPLLASALTALIFAVTGWPFSLFNLMAMVLLLGMGADYGIFLRMAGADRAVAMAAVGLSAATTLLAFGLLALSQTPALHSFGLTLALGLTLTFLIASLISHNAHPQQSE